MKFERWVGGLMVVMACVALPNGASAQAPAGTMPQPSNSGLAQNSQGSLGTSPAVRVVNQPAAVRSMPSLKRGEVMMSAVPGTVLEVLDSQEGWYWVVLARDANGTRKAGWIRAQDVEFVSANQETLEMRSLREKVEQLQREIEKLRNAGDTNANTNTTTSTPPPPPAESKALVKARAELEARQREYDQAVKAANGESEPATPAAKPPSQPVQKPQSGRSQKQSSQQVQKSQSAPGQRPQSMHGFTPVSDTPRFDLFAGYSPLWDTTDSVTYPLGWAASLGKPLNNRMAVVGEVSGSYKSVNALGVNVAKMQLHTFAAGPQFSRRAGTVTAFGQLLGGVAVTTGSALGYSFPSSTGVAVLPGFGADIPVAGNLGVRVGGELGFVHTSFGWSDSFRFMTGLVVTGGAR